MSARSQNDWGAENFLEQDAAEETKDVKNDFLDKIDDMEDPELAAEMKAAMDDPSSTTDTAWIRDGVQGDSRWEIASAFKEATLDADPETTRQLASEVADAMASGANAAVDRMEPGDEADDLTVRIAAGTNAMTDALISNDPRDYEKGIATLRNAQMDADQATGFGEQFVDRQKVAETAQNVMEDIGKRTPATTAKIAGERDEGELVFASAQHQRDFTEWNPYKNQMMPGDPLARSGAQLELDIQSMSSTISGAFKERTADLNSWEKRAVADTVAEEITTPMARLIEQGQVKLSEEIEQRGTSDLREARGQALENGASVLTDIRHDIASSLGKWGPNNSQDTTFQAIAQMAWHEANIVRAAEGYMPSRNPERASNFANVINSAAERDRADGGLASTRRQNRELTNRVQRLEQDLAATR